MNKFRKSIKGFHYQGIRLISCLFAIVIFALTSTFAIAQDAQQFNLTWGMYVTDGMVEQDVGKMLETAFALVGERAANTETIRVPCRLLPF